MQKPSGHSTGNRGFSLVELVIVILITGILVAVAGGFITRPVQGYMDLSRRAALVDKAEMALRRMQRDIRNALPNSIRWTGGAIEMINIAEGIAYRAAGPIGDPLDFTTPDNSFNTIGAFREIPNQVALPLINSAAYRLVISNLGTENPPGTPVAGLNAYSNIQHPGPATPPPIGSHVRPLNGDRISISAAVNNEHTISLNNARQFAFDSPQNRLYLVDGAISYLCNPAPAPAGGTLTRYDGYWWLDDAAQLTTNAGLTGQGANPALVTDQVTACTIAYDATLALVTLDITISDGVETVRLLHQVHVNNAP